MSGQIKQAFYNLIKNASQAIGRAGRFTVRTDLDDEFERVSFRGHGGGDFRGGRWEPVFQPYFTTKESGTGLGVADRAADRAGARGGDRAGERGGEGDAGDAHFPLAAAARLLEGGMAEEDEVMERRTSWRFEI